MRLRRLAASMLGMVVVAGACLSPAARGQETDADRTGSIEGRVVDASGRPAGGVLIMVGGRELTTGSDGRFEVDDLPAAYHELDVVHPEHGRVKVRAPVAGEMTTGLRISFGPEGEAEARSRAGGLSGTASSPPDGDRSGESRIVGRLLDESSGRPVGSATVRLAGPGEQTATSDQGRFTFDSLAAGTYTLRIHHVRYGDRETGVEVPEDRTVDVEIRVAPEAVEVEPVEVTVDADVRRPALEEVGYYERRRWAQKQGIGHFLDAEDVEMRGSEISHVLGSVPQLQASGRVSVGGQRVEGLIYFPRYLEGPFGKCLPAIYLDGHKVVGSGSPAQFVDELGRRGINSLLASPEIAGIEVYESAAATAGEFQASDSRCGVVAIWTRG